MPDDASQHDDRAAEAALVEQACHGCSTSFGTLVQLHQERLYNFMLRRYRNEHFAEEITQAAFVRAWENLSKYDATWRFSTWLYTIAIRLAANIEQRKRPCASIESLSMRPCTREYDPSAAAVMREDGRTVWQLADRILDADHRTALWMRYGDDAPVEQIARVLDRTSGAVRVLLHRARKRLAEAWHEMELATEPAASKRAASSMVCKE